MKNVNYTEEQKLKALQEIVKAMMESLMFAISIDITTRDSTLTDTEKLVDIKRLIQGCYYYQPFAKKYDLISLLS